MGLFALVQMIIILDEKGNISSGVVCVNLPMLSEKYAGKFCLATLRLF
jgi:hypothetical protein